MARPRERVIPSRVDPTPRLPATRSSWTSITVGTCRASSAARSRNCLILEILSKPYNMFSGMEPLSFGGTFLLERVVGTVPVEPDGSALHGTARPTPILLRRAGRTRHGSQADAELLHRAAGRDGFVRRLPRASQRNAPTCQGPGGDATAAQPDHADRPGTRRLRFSARHTTHPGSTLRRLPRLSTNRARRPDGGRHHPRRRPTARCSRTATTC